MTPPDVDRCVAHIPSALRRACGHDSRSVEGCLTCEAADHIEALDAAIRALRQGSEPVAWTLRFHAPDPSAALIKRFPQVLVDGFGEVNPMTTFRTKEEADAYADRSATPPHALPRPLVVPLYAAPPSPAKEG